MSATMTRVGTVWMNVHDAADVLQVDAQVVRRLGKSGIIGTKRVPGGTTTYDRADVERVAKESVKPATRRA